MLSLILSSSISFANVEVLMNGQTYLYKDNPRLTDVLGPVALQQDWYWSSAAVFKLGSQTNDSMRNAATEQLIESSRKDTKNQASYQKIIAQLKSWRLATRIDISIDYELARIEMRNNPAFSDGKYVIDLSTRPTNVYVVGAVSTQTKLNFSENTCLTDYLNEVSTLKIASKDFVYLIGPDGSVDKAGIAYWNSKCVLLMPGTQIYVPLAENPIFSDAATLNQSVVMLLRNRILAK